MEWLQRISPVARPTGSRDRVVAHTGHAKVPAGWHEPFRVIYDHELVLIRRGRFRVEIEDAGYDLDADSFLIIPPGRWHATWRIGKSAGHRYWVHFDWTWQKDERERPVCTVFPATPDLALCHHAPPYVPAELLHGTIRAPARVFDLAERLSAAQRGTPHQRLLGRGLLLELLLELLDPSDPRAQAPGEERLVLRVREYLDRIAAGDTPTPPLAQALQRFGYSYAHLCRLFRNAFGVPPLQYINAGRLGRAQRLLRDTELSVKEIGARVGFPDPVYFGKLFRRHAGVSPRDYRCAR